MCFLPKTKIISLRGIKSFYKLSEGYVSEGTGWLLSHPHRVPAGETEAWFAWFYNRLTSLEHTWKSKRPYNLAYYYTDLDKLQDKSSRLKHDCCPQENPETAPWIARKVEASPVCQHQRPKAAHQSCSWAALNPGVVLSFPSVTCLSLGLGTHHLILGARWPAFSRCMEWHFQCHNFTRNCFTETHLLARLPFLITLYQTNRHPSNVCFTHSIFRGKVMAETFRNLVNRQRRSTREGPNGCVKRLTRNGNAWRNLEFGLIFWLEYKDF